MILSLPLGYYGKNNMFYSNEPGISTYLKSFTKDEL